MRRPYLRKVASPALGCIMSIDISFVNHPGADRATGEAVDRVVMHLQARGCCTWVVINGFQKPICIVA